MATRRAAARAQDHSTPQRLSLLKHLTTSSLPYSALTALFFAERLHALDPAREESVYLLALSLVRLGTRPSEAIWLLRQPVSFNPTPDIEHTNARKFHASKLSRPACEASLRCARLYAQACLAAGRAKEGRDVLAKALASAPCPIPADVAPDLANATVFHPEAEPWVNDLELARLARSAGEHERAIASYRKVLDAHSWCWEALEGLCTEGAPPDPDALFPARPRPMLIPAAPVSPHPAPQKPFPSHPPPLGPSQTSAVNSSVPFAKSRAILPGDLNNSWTPSDLQTPSGTGMVAGGGRGGKFELKGGFGGLGGGAYKKGAQGRGLDLVEMSLDDSSFDNSFYPSQPPPPFAYVHTTSALPPAFSNAFASGSTSLFTPPTTAPTTATAGGAAAAAAAAGVKRARGQQPPVASSSTAVLDDELKSGRRVVRGVPDKKDKQREGSVGAPTRRSSRLSTAAPPAPTSTSMAMSRSQSGRQQQMTVASAPAGARDKKRTKNGTGPSVLSDAGSDALSPTSHSSSPAPSSPGAVHSQIVSAIDTATLEAEDYVLTTLRCFGRAAVAAAKFESARAIEALGALPTEQQRGWRCLVGLGKAHLEMLDYPKAEKAFIQARQAAPHLLEAMELYSTLLWHMRLPTQLSFLAQDLMTIAPREPCSWIAAGNVFSHLEDHAAALKCFKRAAQLDAACVYAYTLSGHECVVLEEWERALGFFREAVRLDERHYNAWFGIGNVYMLTGKYRLAEFHFRKAVEINPSNASLVCCVGSVLEKLGRRREALELYEKACILAPESAAVRFKRVRLLIALKQYQVAETDLLNLKDRAPNEFNVYFLLGKLYKTLDKKPEMLKYFALAQDLEPRTAALIRETINKRLADGMEVDDGDSSGVTQ